MRLAARLGPVVNRLLGIVDKAQGTLLSRWTHGRWAVDALMSAQQSVLTDGPNATELLTGQCGLSYVASDLVALDLGVRGIWRRGQWPIASSVEPRSDDHRRDRPRAGSCFSASRSPRPACACSEPKAGPRP